MQIQALELLEQVARRVAWFHVEISGRHPHLERQIDEDAGTLVRAGDFVSEVDGQRRRAAAPGGAGDGENGCLAGMGGGMQRDGVESGPEVLRLERKRNDRGRT